MFRYFPSGKALFESNNYLGIEGLEPSRFKEPTNFHSPLASGLSLYHKNLGPTFRLPPVGIPLRQAFRRTQSLREVKPIAVDCACGLACRFWRLGLPSKPVWLAKFFLIAPVESLHLSNFFLRLNWLRVSDFFISFSEFESFHFFDFSKKAQILFFKSVASTNSAISPGHPVGIPGAFTQAFARRAKQAYRPPSPFCWYISTLRRER